MRQEFALITSTMEEIEVYHEKPFLIHYDFGIDDTPYVDKNGLFAIAVEWLDHDVVTFKTPDDAEYSNYFASVQYDSVQNYSALFDEGYNFLVVYLSDGTVYKEKLIKLDTTNNEEHQQVAMYLGCNDGDIVSEAMYNRALHMKEVEDKYIEAVNSGELDPATMTQEEMLDLMNDFQYGGIKKGVHMIINQNTEQKIPDDYFFMIYDPDRASVTGDVSMAAVLAKKDESSNNIFFVIGNDGGQASLTSLFGGALGNTVPWQFTSDTTLWDNLVLSDNIEWTDEWVDENNALGLGAGVTVPAATVFADYNGKTIKLTALNLKSVYNAEWNYDTLVYAMNSEYLESLNPDDMTMIATSEFLGSATVLVELIDNDCAELFENLDPVSVILYQMKTVTKMIQDTAEVTYKPGKKIGTLTEVKAGEYELGDLRYGKYFLREVKAPEGFLLDDNYYPFEITKNGEIVIVSNAEYFKDGIPEKNIDGKKLVGLFGNEPIYAPVVITKTDAVDGKKLPGAGFRIKDADGNVVAEGYTDENGEFEAYLRYGKYSYEEFEAPEGYEINTAIGYFEILEDGEIIKAQMEDERIADTDGFVSAAPTVNAYTLLYLFFFVLITINLIHREYIFKKREELANE